MLNRTSLKHDIVIGFLLIIVNVPMMSMTTGADFLKIPRSARAIALGDSYTAVIGDATAIEYNPAALNTIENLAFNLMYQKWIDDTFTVYASAAYCYYSVIFGASFYYVDYGLFQQYGSFGDLISIYHFADYNLKLALSFDGGLLFNFLTGFSIGGSASLLHRKLLNTTSQGVTFDVGFNYTFSLKQLFGGNITDETYKMPFNIGLSVQNLGYAQNALTPVKGTLGISIGIIKNLYIAMDATIEYGRPFLYKMGIEYALANIIILRAGFNLGKEIGNLAFGVGLRYPEHFNDFRLDYAYSYMGIMGNNHNFSLYIDFPVFTSKSEFYYNEGIYYFIRGDYLKAKEYLEKALEADPNNKLIREKLKDIEKLIELDIKTEGQEQTE